MNRGFQRIVSALQVAVIALLAVLLARNLYRLVAQHLLGVEYPSLLGYSTAVVVSGSMEPTLSVDDLLVIHQESDYTPGDIITFRSGSVLVTHRIVDETPQGFVTQGDANNAPDAQPVPPENIQGKVVTHIPFVGLVIGYLKTPVGLTILVFLGLLTLEFPLFMHLLQKGVDLDEETKSEP